MNMADLEKLNYPLFETTEEEKKILEASLKRWGCFLCVRLTDFRATHPVEHKSLIRKIQSSIRNSATLEEYLTGVWGIEDNFGRCRGEIRDIWTDKLLKYEATQVVSNV